MNNNKFHPSRFMLYLWWIKPVDGAHLSQRKENEDGPILLLRAVARSFRRWSILIDVENLREYDLIK